MGATKDIAALGYSAPTVAHGFTSLGDGAYKITSAQSGLAADVFNCSAAAGAKPARGADRGDLLRQRAKLLARHFAA